MTCLPVLRLSRGASCDAYNSGTGSQRLRGMLSFAGSLKVWVRRSQNLECPKTGVETQGGHLPFQKDVSNKDRGWEGEGSPDLNKKLGQFSRIYGPLWLDALIS